MIVPEIFPSTNATGNMFSRQIVEYIYGLKMVSKRMTNSRKWCNTQSEVTVRNSAKIFEFFLQFEYNQTTTHFNQVHRLLTGEKKESSMKL